MNDFSIFVDESGDVGETSDFYLIVLVLHNQGLDLQPHFKPYELSLKVRALDDIPMHLGPLLQGHDAYEHMTIDERKKYLYSFAVLAEHLPINYAVFSYEKRLIDHDPNKLLNRLKRDLALFFIDHSELFQNCAKVKIYYDNGQAVVTTALHDAVEYALAKSAIVYKDACPKDYRLFQMADYLCTLELTALKFKHHKERKTDKKFFGEWGSFKKNYLRKIRKRKLD